eukprot:16714-Chlamydomonas_euryale.AAC.4
MQHPGAEWLRFTHTLSRSPLAAVRRSNRAPTPSPAPPTPSRCGRCSKAALDTHRAPSRRAPPKRPGPLRVR